MTPTNTHATPQPTLYANPSAIVDVPEEARPEQPAPIRYRLHWRNTITGSTSHGLLIWTQEQAQQLADQCQRACTKREYWVEKDKEARE